MIRRKGARPTRRPRVVIVGAGFGGLTAAQTLARYPVEIIVIDRKNHHTWGWIYFTQEQGARWITGGANLPGWHQRPPTPEAKLEANRWES